MGAEESHPRPQGEAVFLKEPAGAGRYGTTMKFGAIEILLVCLGTVVLTLIVLWIREEVADWRSSRSHRDEERRSRSRRDPPAG
jgi:hypothetical protein